MTATVTLAQKLIRKASVTPDDKGCQDLVADELRPHGFTPEFMPFGEVRNPVSYTHLTLPTIYSV